MFIECAEYNFDVILDIFGMQFKKIMHDTG